MRWNAYDGETEDTFPAPHTCMSTLCWTNQRQRTGDLDQSEARTEITACGECHKFLGRDILGTPSVPGSGGGRGFSEADMKQCSCDLSPDWPDNIPNINPAITCSCFYQAAAMNEFIADKCSWSSHWEAPPVHSFYKNGSSRLIRYTKESGEFYVVSYFPPGHVSLGPLSSISQSQEASRGQAPHFSKHSKRNSLTHDSEFSEVKTNFCCCCHELNLCPTEFFWTCILYITLL